MDFCGGGGRPEEDGCFGVAAGRDDGVSQRLNAMLAKRFRLPLAQRASFLPARSFRGRFFLVRVAFTSRPLSRFGVVVGKKIAAKAVARNRVRRHALRWIAARRLHLFPGRDALLIALSGAAEVSVNNLERDLISIFHSLGAFPLREL